MPSAATATASSPWVRPSGCVAARVRQVAPRSSLTYSKLVERPVFGSPRARDRNDPVRIGRADRDRHLIGVQGAGLGDLHDSMGLGRRARPAHGHEQCDRTDPGISHHMVPPTILRGFRPARIGAGRGGGCAIIRLFLVPSAARAPRPWRIRWPAEPHSDSSPCSRCSSCRSPPTRWSRARRRRTFRPTRLVNARIVPVSTRPIPSGTLVLRGGQIVAIGPNVDPPADAIVMDADGWTLYPGFVDAHSSIGMPKPPTLPQDNTARACAIQTRQRAGEPTPGLTPQLEAVAEYSADRDALQAARNVGITSAAVVPSFGVFKGQSAIVTLRDGLLTDQVVRGPVGTAPRLPAPTRRVPRDAHGRHGVDPPALPGRALVPRGVGPLPHPAGDHRPARLQSSSGIASVVRGRRPAGRLHRLDRERDSPGAPARRRARP